MFGDLDSRWSCGGVKNGVERDYAGGAFCFFRRSNTGSIDTVTTNQASKRVRMARAQAIDWAGRRIQSWRSNSQQGDSDWEKTKKKRKSWGNRRLATSASDQLYDFGFVRIFLNSWYPFCMWFSVDMESRWRWGSWQLRRHHLVNIHLQLRYALLLLLPKYLFLSSS